MTKLLRFLGLTTIISSTSVLTLTHSNNNQNFLTNQSINSNNTTKAVIDNINKSMSVTAKPGNDRANENYNVYDKILNLSWKEAQTITSGIVTNYFKHSLARGEKEYTELHLNLMTDNPRPDSVRLSGILVEFDTDKAQLSDIFVSIHIYKEKNNPNITRASFNILIHAENQGASEPVSTSCFIDKIILNA